MLDGWDWIGIGIGKAIIIHQSVPVTFFNTLPVVYFHSFIPKLIINKGGKKERT